MFWYIFYFTFSCSSYQCWWVYLFPNFFYNLFSFCADTLLLQDIIKRSQTWATPPVRRLEFRCSRCIISVIFVFFFIVKVKIVARIVQILSCRSFIWVAIRFYWFAHCWEPFGNIKLFTISSFGHGWIVIILVYFSILKYHELLCGLHPHYPELAWDPQTAYFSLPWTQYYWSAPDRIDNTVLEQLLRDLSALHTIRYRI